MRILIATAQVPFVTGGAEAHAQGLMNALRAAGHETDIIAIPFKWYPPARLVDSILMARLLDISEACGVRVDLMVGLKFPAYLIPHPRKVLWILHQLRSAYDLWGHEFGDLHRFPDGAHIRDLIEQTDRRLIPEASKVYANSENIARRLKTFCGIDSTPLYHPPPFEDQFHGSTPRDYFYFPSRINPLKRQQLVLEALARTRNPVLVHFSGGADELQYSRAITALAAKLGVSDRVSWLGHITQEEKVKEYSNCLAVLFPPVDEDYGYVSLEAMLSGKPIVTCSDSGGPLEFVQHRQTGLVAGPSPEELAGALDSIWENRAHAESMGRAGLDFYRSLNISWKNVVTRLTSCG